MKSDIILLTFVFEKFLKVSIFEIQVNFLYCVSLPGFTWLCGLKNTDKKLQTLQDEEIILISENNIRVGVSSVLGDRYVKSDGNKKILYMHSV